MHFVRYSDKEPANVSSLLVYPPCLYFEIYFCVYVPYGQTYPLYHII